MSAGQDIIDMATTRPEPPKATLIRGIADHYFKTPVDSMITIVIVGFALWLVPQLFSWTITNAVIHSADASACKLESAGACWAVIVDNIRYILLGTYPVEQSWRPISVIAILFALGVVTCIPGTSVKRMAAIWLLSGTATLALMRGGVFGLPVVETTRWGGLPLTMILAVFGLMGSLPLGIGLALARRSQLPVIRLMATGYTELMRGVPLISVLFMASVMLPLFLPQGMTVDRIARALIALTLFASAYVAEVIRAGLQAIPKGQFEAAAAGGLTTFQTYRLVVLPQALRLVIPSLVNTYLEFFKDTSLVMIIGLLDLFSTSRSVLNNPEWLPYSVEVYLFLGMFYFACCYGMSRYSYYLERKGN